MSSPTPKLPYFDSRTGINKTYNYLVTTGRGDALSCAVIWYNHCDEILILLHKHAPVSIDTRPPYQYKTLDEINNNLRKQNPHYLIQGATIPALVWTLISDEFGQVLEAKRLSEQDAFHLDVSRGFNFLTGRRDS